MLLGGEPEARGDVVAEERVVALGLEDEALQAGALLAGEDGFQLVADYFEGRLGGVVGAGGADVADGEQQAIVLFEQGVERLLLLIGAGERGADGVVAHQEDGGVGERLRFGGGPARRGGLASRRFFGAWVGAARVSSAMATKKERCVKFILRVPGTPGGGAARRVYASSSAAGGIVKCSVVRGLLE